MDVPDHVHNVGNTVLRCCPAGVVYQSRQVVIVQTACFFGKGTARVFGYLTIESVPQSALESLHLLVANHHRQRSVEPPKAAHGK
jgi:hypothetical protein